MNWAGLPNGRIEDGALTKGPEMNQESHQSLDNPAWSALATKHAHLRLGGVLARCYEPEVAPFAALAAHTPAAFQELQQLLREGQQAALLTLGPLEKTYSLLAEHRGILHQMVAWQRIGDSHKEDEEGVLQLSAADVPDMLDLVEKTKPGPFGPRTYQMGKYIGMRDQGKLIAMAGERMRFDGYTEISAVCVDENYRGKGFAARLMQIVRRGIEQRGETPFLHVFDTNLSAIRLYEHLGFELRQVFHLDRVRLP